MADHILLVDDNEDFITAGQQFLATLGYHVTTASDGEQALDAVALERPDIILMDVMMPRLNGWDTLKALQSDPETAHIPVLMLTALRGSDPVKQSFHSGSTWFYPKPILDYHDLLLVIRRVLDQQEQPANE